MYLRLGFLMACLGACVPAASRSDGGLLPDGGLDDGGVTVGCLADGDCPDGMLCAACATGETACVPGCRDDGDCREGYVCELSVACLTCPCPPGWCQLDPCRDADGDGYAPREVGTCPGLSIGDCNDANPTVFPGAVELCHDWVDNDCDGRRDGADADSCAPSCDAGWCNTDSDCNDGACERGCCIACPSIVPPACEDAGHCLQPGGLDARACRQPPVCVDCGACIDLWAPVCGANFATYSNDCFARLAGTTVLHDGECLWGEGDRCASDGSCQGSLFCRDFCPGCETPSFRCSKVGTCTTANDCAHVSGVPTCADGGVTPWVCREGRCGTDCR